jgi:general secretion pathway protein D
MLDELARLIESLDVQQTQVLVEALIASLSEDETRELAVEMQKLVGVDGALGQVSTLFGLGASAPGSTALPPASGTGLEAAVLDPGAFSGVLRALESVNDGRVLTIPKVLVNNHETANLDSVVQTPYASTNASTTVATTSFGGTLDAGTTIAVRPQITDGDQLLIDYTVSLSSFVGAASDPDLPPPRQENRLKSTATVPDGYTVVVGGLEIEQEGESETRVPLLGSIPLVGALFRSSSETTTKARFFVFLRCSVFRNAQFADLRYASQPDLEAASIPSGVPVLEPRVIR